MQLPYTSLKNGTMQVRESCHCNMLLHCENKKKQNYKMIKLRISTKKSCTVGKAMRCSTEKAAGEEETPLGVLCLGHAMGVRLFRNCLISQVKKIMHIFSLLLLYHSVQVLHHAHMNIIVFH
ncbi:unnamed protein product [Ixodes persulcatus]